jgi:hypothetical protein
MAADKPLVFTYCLTLFVPMLSCALLWIIYECEQAQPTIKTTRRKIMKDTRIEDYTKDDNDGHIDTRARNHECENPDPRLGCDLGIDVAG